MPTPEKEYPLSIAEWSQATPSEFKEWVLHIANEHLYHTDDVAYDFLSTLAIVLKESSWTYTKPGDPFTSAEIGVLEVDEYVIDTRATALGFAVSSTNGTSTSIARVVEIAKEYEKYLMGRG